MTDQTSDLSEQTSNIPEPVLPLTVAERALFDKVMSKDPEFIQGPPHGTGSGKVNYCVDAAFEAVLRKEYPKDDIGTMGTWAEVGEIYEEEAKELIAEGAVDDYLLADGN